MLRLARRVPLSLVDGATGEVEPLPWRQIVESPRPQLSISEAEQLTETCNEARLTDLAAAAPFPDWLGYLGMILSELEGFHRCRLRIGQEWSRQFVAMGGERMKWSRFEQEALSWRDLELAEHERLGLNNLDAAT